MIWQTTGKGTKERSEKNRKNSDKESDDDCMGLQYSMGGLWVKVN